MPDIKSPPLPGDKIPFSWFTWFKKVKDAIVLSFSREGDTFIGAARIRGDFANADHTQRVLFENSYPDNTFVGAVPVDSSVASGFLAYGSSDIANANFAEFIQAGPDTIISASKQGTASYGGIYLWTSDTIQFSIAANGNLSAFGKRYYADYSNATITDRHSFVTTATDSPTSLQVLPNGTSNTSAINVFNNSDPTNAGYGGFMSAGGSVVITAGVTGSGSYQNMLFSVGGGTKLSIDTDGKIGINTTPATARLKVAQADGTFTLLLSGSTKGVRVHHSSAVSAIEGVDSTGTGSYQPLYVGGSTLDFSISGTSKATLDATGKMTFTNDAYVGSNVIYHAGNLPSLGGKLKSQIYDTSGASGSWTWPSGVDSCWVTLVGAGGGGAGNRNGVAVGACSGGGAGETLLRVPYPRNGVATTSYSVGTAGSGGAGSTGTNGNAGTAGGDTTFGSTLVAKGGGAGAYNSGSATGGTGGGSRQVADASNSVGSNAVIEGLTSESGSNGGGASNTTSGKAGGKCEQFSGGTGGTGNGGGGGGGASYFAAGANGANATAGTAATPTAATKGAGGGGGGANSSGAATAGGTGGAGGPGYILIEWIE